MVAKNPRKRGSCGDCSIARCARADNCQKKDEPYKMGGEPKAVHCAKQSKYLRRKSILIADCLPLCTLSFSCASQVVVEVFFKEGSDEEFYSFCFRGCHTLYFCCPCFRAGRDRKSLHAKVQGRFRSSRMHPQVSKWLIKASRLYGLYRSGSLRQW